MNLGLARLQFASTTIFHFIFVPVTIGLAFLIAILQTKWHRSGGEDERRLIRFFGVLLVLNVGIGVVTGIVQEFEFGMNWSTYSRYVGDVFGAPLAMEGLAAFFLESTFLGLWIFGWDRLPKRVHLACIWFVSLGSVLSAAFIMAANSWMQHPVGYTINKATGRAQLNDIWSVFGNPVFIWGFVHVLLASLVTGSIVMLAVSAWHLRRQKNVDAFTKTAKLSLVVLLPTSILALMIGSHLGIVETDYQPMKIAAAEGQWQTCQPCSFSLFQIGGGQHDETPTKIIQVPHLLSVLATGTWNGKVVGLNPLNTQDKAQYGPGYYVPNVFTQYWSMRAMAYTGSAVAAMALWGCWIIWRRSLANAKWFLWVATWAAVTPFIMNTAGWLLTENGRQPWIVQGLLKTANGVSSSVSATSVWITLIGFLVLYAILGVVDLVLMLRFGRQSLDESDGLERLTATSQVEPTPGLGY